jgi:hypothetical protein
MKTKNTRSGSPRAFAPAALAALLAAAGCGKSEPLFDYEADLPALPFPEICDGLDNDLDGEVDEPFKNDDGAYVHDLHCGACESACLPDAVSAAAACLVGPHGPACGATECLEGHVLTAGHACVPWGERLCRPCLEDAECGDFGGARCVVLDGEPRCAVQCLFGACPDGWLCGAGDLCRPPSGSCSCVPGESYAAFCEIPIDEEQTCIGAMDCADGVLGPCAGSDELCDGVDNDCNGVVDDPFVNVHGAYGIDIHNCGGCGVDCTANPFTEDELLCGGPATHPLCQVVCFDADDGIQVGDQVDADLLIATGCECTVTDLDDQPGPLLASGPALDSNCDGADGIVELSFYVSPDGADTAIGSPWAPKRTIGAAVEAAFASLSTAAPRPHVFVAAGSYAEVLRPRDGILIHGGYDPGFDVLDPASYVVEVHPPSWSAAVGGAGLEAVGVGFEAAALVEGFVVHGAAAPGPGQSAIGAYLRNCGPLLRLERSVVAAGDGADGTDGANGAAGSTAAVAGKAGDPPRAAVESPSHACLAVPGNTVAGGTGASKLCGAVSTHGGGGGSPACPGEPDTHQPGGAAGASVPSAPGGSGGSGGWNCRGPMFDYDGCPQSVCCGLAHFLVSESYAVPGDGSAGARGPDGGPGNGCAAPLGTLLISSWLPGNAGAGTAAGSGSGGGGGGAGGGALMQWTPGQCEFADGLGGGGGGGGAGGCGGGGGAAGTAGSPSIGILVSYDMFAPAWASGPPTIGEVLVQTGGGGAGGRGGVGGSGGLGSAGGAGGSLEPEDLVTPTLAGTAGGGWGGSGGSGGNGGGGGGGCGGSVVGIWLASGGLSFPGAAAAYLAGNWFAVGGPGPAGPGGAGSAAGGDGAVGEVHDVLAQ